MRLFDPHIHMNARTTDDYERMASEGIWAVCEPAFWSGQPRTSVGTYDDYLKTIIGWERFRASQFGIHHFCTISLNPREANNPDLADGVIDLIPRYIHKEGVVGIGEIGLDDRTPEEEKYFAIQLEMAKKYQVIVIIHTPHRSKKEGTERIISIVKESGIPEESVVIDHNTEETLPIVLQNSHCWAGHTIYPKTKMSKQRMVHLVQKYGAERIIINSSADWGISDPLNVAKTCQLMKEQGFSEATLEKLFWQNPMDFFQKSSHFNPDEIQQPCSIDQNKSWQGNTVLRGQEPVVQVEKNY
ncbi:MAG: TatD family hydrolase [Candidatus Brocadiae bacterium]|nr:TatD family hydrolase [Candidatus Brocadiia bacterium]